MEIVPFKVNHLRQIKVQAFSRGVMHMVDIDSLVVFEDTGYAYTAIDGDEVLAVAGVIDFCDGRGLVWSFLADDIGSRLIGVTKAVKRFLKDSKFRRYEMAVDCDYKQAHRWAAMLGFSMECERMHKYTPDGRDCALYAMVKE